MTHIYIRIFQSPVGSKMDILSGFTIKLTEAMVEDFGLANSGEDPCGTSMREQYLLLYMDCRCRKFAVDVLKCFLFHSESNSNLDTSQYKDAIDTMVLPYLSYVGTLDLVFASVGVLLFLIFCLLRRWFHGTENS